VDWFLQHFNSTICYECKELIDSERLAKVEFGDVKMTFMDKMERDSNYKYTENLALTHTSTLDNVLDFFSLGGALRARSETDIWQLFMKAFAQDRLLALKCLFYLRDIRGGQGERRTFRTVINGLGKTYPLIINKNLQNVPFFGRWDDLYELIGTGSEKPMWEYLHEQLVSDVQGESPSLLAKWLKSENTSSTKSRRLGKLTRQALGFPNAKTYRKILSELRKKIDIVERKMCSNEWNGIKFENVPSRASMIYSKAFRKHEPERYQAYLDAVKKGEKTIKTATLYPYDILRAICKQTDNIEALNVMWDNQKDWLDGKEEPSIVVCDTSGSMGSLRSLYERQGSVEPILVAVSLAMYFAERNKHPAFNNTFITFSIAPQIQRIKGKTLYDKAINLNNAHWDGNTNLQAVFDLILNTAQRHKVSEDEMIKKIYIISDMEFDSATTSYRSRDATNFEAIKQKYADAGYQMPTLVFWNVDARQNQAPITFDEKGVFLVSGCSPSIFESLMASKVLTPVDMMLEVLNKERYSRIVV